MNRLNQLTTSINPEKRVDTMLGIASLQSRGEDSLFWCRCVQGDKSRRQADWDQGGRIEEHRVRRVSPLYVER